MPLTLRTSLTNRVARAASALAPVLLLAALVSALDTAPVGATTLWKFGARDQASKAAAIVVATPVRVETAPLDTAFGRVVFTYTTLAVERVLKGRIDPASPLVIKNIGGTYAREDLVTDEEEVPLLRTGRRYLLVLGADRTAPWGSYFLQSRGFGAYAVSEDRSGVIWLERQTARAAAVPYGVRAPEDVLTLADFEEALRTAEPEALERDAADAPQVPDGFVPGTGEEIDTSAASFVVASPAYRFVQCDAGAAVQVLYNPAAYDWSGSLATAVTWAANQWSSVAGSRLRVANAGTTTECGWRPVNHNFTVTGDCLNEVEGSGCASGVIAMGGARWFTGANVTVNGTQFRVVDTAHVVLNSGACDLDQSGVNGVVTHEMGHALGFAHATSPACCTPATPTMYPAWFADMNTLADDDKNAVRFVYPAPPGPPAISSLSPSSGERGASVTVHVYGTDLMNGATSVTVSGSGISPAPAIAPASTATDLVVTFGILSSANLTSRTLTVTTAYGTSSKPFEVVAIAAPGDLSGTATSATSVRLTWTDASRVETSYKVQRYQGSTATWITLATLAAGSTAYTDTGLASGRSYRYRLKVSNATDSATSNVTNVTTP